MTNGADSHSHVTRIEQRNDNTVEVHVQTASFAPGQPVEVSGYLIQGSGAYAAFNVKKHIPLGASPVVLHVQLPAMVLDPAEDVTVVTRVAEVWPTALGQEINPQDVGKGLIAAWTAKDSWGKGSGGPASPPPGSGGGGATTSPPA
jgi:hypothetical protein